MSKKVAVVLFNLGGPDCPDAVQPFLFNLFNDKRIISLPNPFRFLLAKLISKKRSPIAKEIYEYIGGKSPILEKTQKQSQALEKKLNEQSDDGYKVFISMRYWHPFSSETVNQVAEYSPDEVVLLPLYPQYSTTTSASSLEDWNKQVLKKRVKAPTKTVCCYFDEQNFIEAHTESIQPVYKEAKQKGAPRVLFSAHGLPKKVIDKGDPYQWQVEQTAQKVVGSLNIDELDWVVCYQSKVGPLEWIGPSTEDEIDRAIKDQIPVVIVPIAFVSEHSETLVELDIEYKKIAEQKGIKGYFRVPALGGDDKFIDSLAKLCLNSGESGGVCSHTNERLCPAKYKQCPCH